MKSSPKISEEYIKNTAEALNLDMPKNYDMNKLLAASHILLKGNTLLQRAAYKNPASFIGSILTTVRLGLTPNTETEECIIVPDVDMDGNIECRCKICRNGLVTLALRYRKTK